MSIAIIDLNDFYDNKAQFIQDLEDAFHTLGFVGIINTGIDVTILDNSYNSYKEFFKKDLDFKMSYNKPELNGQKGFVRSEKAQGSIEKDNKEFYHISSSGDNIWPEIDNFKESTELLIKSLNYYAYIIEVAISESLKKFDKNIGSDFFSNMTLNGDSLLRTIYYPSNCNPTNRKMTKSTITSMWAAAHYDIDLFTILPRSTLEGLQILNKETWIDANVPPDAIIVNVGDLLQNITNGYYKSAKHRVLCKDPFSPHDRHSSVFFVHPRPDVRLDPLECFGPKKYPNATQKELLDKRLEELGLKIKL